jgi:hypothetical protein
MSPNNPTPSNVVKGSPSKELFVSMLTRDITLIDAISDLVDNCVDGAIRLKGRGKFTGLEADVTVTEDCFKIKDNCGGIDKELAQKYAFRFGRPLDAAQIDYSVGQFGIGMKRALFKMGNNFEIKSVSAKTSFTIEIDVKKWSEKEDEWDFEFKKTEEKKSSLSECGTEITVTSLNKNVEERFKDKLFLTELKQKLEVQHLINISRGLTVKINGDPIKAKQLELHTGKFKTAYWEKNFKTYGNMNVKIYVGIGEYKNKNQGDMGGWYIFCNNRLIKGPEQTEITGWDASTPVSIPKYHIQYSRFRGFVFFEVKEPTHLPWTTAKNEIDIDSPIFRAVRLEMILLMLPVKVFLDEVHKESGDFANGRLEKKYLQSEIDSASLKSFSDVQTSKEFIAPHREHKTKKRDEVTITYKKTKDKVDKIKKLLGVSSAKEVGEQTFENFYKRECQQ